MKERERKTLKGKEGYGKGRSKIFIILVFIGYELTYRPSSKWA